MPKAKDGPALFELIERQRKNEPDALKVPSWWTHSDSESDDFGRRDEGCAEPELTSAVVTTDADSINEPSDPAKTHRLIEIDGQCVRFTFTSTTCAVVVFALMMLLILSHKLGTDSGYDRGLRVGHERGRATYAASAANEIELAKASPPETSLVDSLLINPASGQGGEANVSQTQWVKGLTYIVAQEFLAGRDEDALLARQFLAKRGIDTELVKTKRGATQLITTRGYNHKDRVQKQMADVLLEKVRAVGEEYFTSGGGYKLNGYYRTLTRDSWRTGAG